MKIAVDAFGGDNAPLEIIKGAVAAKNEYGVDIVILTLPKAYADEIVDRIVTCKNVKGIWNFTGKELDIKDSNIVVEDVHMGDSLMTLCYELCRMQAVAEDIEADIQ